MSASAFDVMPASSLTVSPDAPAAWSLESGNTVSEPAIAAFERDGVVCLRGGARRISRRNRSRCGRSFV